MKARELIRLLESHGGALVRKSGDHHRYRLGPGMLSVPAGGRQAEVSDGLLGRARRLFRAAGIFGVL